jgi:hypothetical protein
MKFVQILIKVPPVNSEVPVHLKNIESPEINVAFSYIMGTRYKIFCNCIMATRFSIVDLSAILWQPDLDERK